MRVIVRLFARLRDIAGADELDRQVDEGETVRGIWNGLTREFPELAAYDHSVSAALNADYVRMEATVQADDEVAFLPPVSGGREEGVGD
jgi:molybdopterin converting factor subunit 1